MSEKQINKDFFKSSEEDFAEHLTLNNNHRILFSARYGAGKTTFLKHFFSEESKVKEATGKNYKAIHLFPVNYQVSANEDIFELIKYDIIAHLLSDEDFVLEKNDIPAYQAIPYFISKRPADFIAPLLHFLGNTGKVYENYMKLYEEVKQQYEQAKENEHKALTSFFKTAKDVKGSIYENDFFTELIKKILQRWKNSEGENEQDNSAELVLIIDDLDRIDPQHAFRLFNIFAAHFDIKEDSSANKFGFDKIIFVCDIQNVRNSFHHNYGTDVEFSGYIDKFFSTTPYSFSLEKDIENLSQSIVTKLELLGAPYERDVPDSLKNDLTILLYYFQRTQAISLRALMKISNLSITLQEKEIKRSTYVEHNRMFHVVLLMDISVQIIGSAADLNIAFQKCQIFQENSDRQIVRHRDLLGDILYFIDYHKIKKGTRQHLLRYRLEDSDIEILYTPISQHRSHGVNIEKYENHLGEEVWDNPNIFPLYQKVVSILLDIDYFKF